MLYVFIVLHAGLWCILLGNLLYLHHRRDLHELPEPRPSLSVLIPARNESTNLKRLIPSLLRQSYNPLEIIVYDDGSTDDTLQVLRQFNDDRLRVLQGDAAPPDGWIGKVHALYQASRRASGDLYLFLDADTMLTGPNALFRLVSRLMSRPRNSVLTAMPRLAGGGQLLVSMVPNAILASLPWPLVRRQEIDSLGALNGQCWMIRAEDYHAHEPHEALRDEILEDVEIGRLLKQNGIYPEMVDASNEVTVYMYETFSDAWRGFRKNAYLIMGGGLGSFVPLFIAFVAIFIVAPLIYWPLVVSVYGLKAITDRVAGIPWWISLLAPVSYVLAAILQLDSAFHHLRGSVSWKGRPVGDTS